MKILGAALITLVLGFVLGRYSVEPATTPEVSANGGAVSASDPERPAVANPGSDTQSPKPNGIAEPTGPDTPSTSSSLAQQILNQMENIPIFKLRRACDEVEQLWLVRNLDDRLDRPKSEKDLEAWDQLLHESMKSRLRQSSHWVASTDVTSNGRSVRFTFLMTFEVGDEKRVEQPTLELKPEDDLCYSLDVIIEFDGNRLGTGSGGCRESLRKLGDVFYAAVQLYSFEELGKLVALLIVPLPTELSGPLQYFETALGRWEQNASLTWQSSTRVEFERLKKSQYNLDP